MRQHPVAKAYARALLEVGLDRGKADEYDDELVAIRDQVLADRDTRIFLESPNIPRAEKIKVFEGALESKVSDAVLNLVRILITRGRQFLFDAIVEAYQALADDHAGRTHVKITSAAALTDAARERVVSALGTRLGREIVPHEKVDDALLGGMTIQIGDTMVDASVRSRLNEIRERATALRLGSDLIDES